MIAKVGVIGAGVMGGGIAAQVANAGVPVLLLDMPGVAAAALERLGKTTPAPFMSREAARLVVPGDIEADAARLADCGWIVEAVAEDLGVKHALYRRIAPFVGPDAILSSNTSTIPRRLLARGMDDGLARRFLITHFFNPPRYMRLMELVAPLDAERELVERIREFCDRRLGKSVVDARDTPGFVANRIGAYWMQAAMNAAFDHGLGVEEADMAIGALFGVPRTGIFGLLDLIGLDLMPKVASSLTAQLPPDDAYSAIWRREPLVERLIAEGYTGRKGRGGFYRLGRGPGGERIREALDLRTGDWRPAVERRRKDAPDPVQLLSDSGPRGDFARAVVAGTLAYAAALVPEIAERPEDVDRAMRLGYGWRLGPFELADRIGAKPVADAIAASGGTAPSLLTRAAELGGFYAVESGQLHCLGPDGNRHPVERPAGVLLLEDVKRRSAPLIENGSAALWDLGDGVTCFEFRTKRNSIDPDLLDLLARAIDLTARSHRAMVIYSDGPDFSVGANLALGLFAANIALFDDIARLVEAGQKVFAAIAASPVPVVAAPAGMALGGACELLMHATAVQAHAETYCGLVETAVGLVPAWGGTARLLERAAIDPKLPKGPMPAVMRAFETIAAAKVSGSAEEAKSLLFLGPFDGITMNRDRLLADAKALSLSLTEDGRRRSERPSLRLPGPSGRAALMIGVEALARAGKATAYDQVVATKLAQVVTGGDADPIDEIEGGRILALESGAFMDLIRMPETLARIEHMLETGKPLRN